jgi:hypothetical protein
MQRVTDDYPFLSDLNKIWSVGGHSREWLRETFISVADRRLENTAYVSANHYADTVSDRPFASFENVNTLEYETNAPAAPAHVVTDRAVTRARDGGWNRLVVHYMQPHKPFLTRSGSRRDIEVETWSLGKNLYHAYFSGQVTKQDLHQGYVDNLRYVLEEVSLLLENVDAPETVITADHGNALGERFLWDHQEGVQYPAIRQVPWIRTEAQDTQSLEPPAYNQADRGDAEIEDRLKALGYR